MDQSLLETMRVVALPTKTNFRGITIREVALFQGEYGWGEFSPFLEYDYKESAPWLACAIEAATKPRPKLYRNSVKVNGTIPAINYVATLESIVSSFPGVETFTFISPCNPQRPSFHFNSPHVLATTVFSCHVKYIW